MEDKEIKLRIVEAALSNGNARDLNEIMEITNVLFKFIKEKPQKKRHRQGKLYG
jgi:hypothetical protein